jgi:hypothetical protein
LPHFFDHQDGGNISSETSVDFQHISRCYILEDRNLYIKIRQIYGTYWSSSNVSHSVRQVVSSNLGRDTGNICCSSS